ncbi:hypothetical protein QYR00_14950 [Agrobacterium tumefaciens]|nr:hypothetical protein QYR00_14950 [Agrobacterium tumefaciens]
MISIVLYGRNDSYGYNLHKRAALSLNCMAEVLTDENDEILFVDYNTPDDFPTFPEAICDTLTDRAKRLLRIIRIRPSLHNQLFASRTHLKALEPISRNAAVRRSNPANRWILSTNTDMIFVPRGSQSLSEQLAGLKDGFYCTPRFEIPETLWESFDRLDPAGVIAETRAVGENLHLNEIVYGADSILYDAPGDFQLMRREDLFSIHGFDEQMLLGWHVDSNISRRLVMLHGKVSDAVPAVFGYHCDHTRQTTPMHAHKSVENDPERFINRVAQPDIPEQSEFWGLNGIDLEEIRLTDTINTAYRSALAEAIGTPLKQPLEARYRSESYDREIGTPEHVLPFLVDLFANAPRETRVVWIGLQDQVLTLFSRCWDKLGFSNRVTVWQAGSESSATLTQADAFVINFGLPDKAEGEDLTSVLNGFFAAIGAEHKHLAEKKEPRRFIGVNAVHNRFESLMQRFIGCGRTPFSARLRHGYLLQSIFKEVDDWTSEMRAGAAGTREKDVIRSNDEVGHIFFGPYAHLPPGNYRIDLTLSRRWDHSWKCRLNLDLIQGERVVYETKVNILGGKATVRLPLHVAPRDILLPLQVRLHSSGKARITLEGVLIERTSKLAEDWSA